MLWAALQDPNPVPAFDATDRLLGAINISTNAARVDLDTLLGEHLPLLREKARQIREQVC